MKIIGLESNSAIIKELGERIRDSRIGMSLTREELARRSGVSERTIANIELGNGITLDKFICILRALGMLGNFDLLVTDQHVRPSDLAKLGGKRKRARSSKKDAGAWVWGDEA